MKFDSAKYFLGNDQRKYQLLFVLILIASADFIRVHIVPPCSSSQCQGLFVDLLYVLAGILCFGMGRCGHSTSAMISIAIFMDVMGHAADYLSVTVKVALVKVPWWREIFGHAISVESAPYPKDLTFNSLGVMVFGSPEIYLVIAFFSAPLLEEMIRGFMQDGMAPLVGGFVAFLVTTALSIFMHWKFPLGQAPSFIVLGIAAWLGYSWLERFVIHSVSNVVATLYFLHSGYFNVYSYGDIQTEKLVVAIVTIAISVMVIFKAMVGGRMLPFFHPLAKGRNEDATSKD